MSDHARLTDLWLSYQAAERDRIRDRSLQRLERFLAAFDSADADVGDDIACRLMHELIDEKSDTPIRMPLFRRLMFPFLARGVLASRPHCARWLAHCDQLPVSHFMRYTMTRFGKVTHQAMLIALLWVSGISAGLAQQRAPLLQSFDLQVPWNPSAVRVAGKDLLVYELHLTNFARNDLALKRIQVVNAETGAVVGDFHDAELQGLIGRPDQPGEKKDRLIIAPGVRVVAYLSLPVAPACASACRLMHVVQFASAQSPEGESPATVKGGAVTVRARPVPMLGPPLRGGPWVAVYGSSWERGHRRTLYAVDGAVHVPGRFAIDWIKLGADGKYAAGDASKVESWPGYGADVLAVADAVVASAKDDIPESSTISSSVKVALENASGNYISLNLGDGHYVFYEHLKPGSIMVKPGEHVRRGQVIGQLGYTGESTGPHLHLHVADADLPLGAEGVPYGFAHFKLLGAYPSIEAFGKSEAWTPRDGRDDAARSSELPAPLAVIEFPEK
jgi:hypothetical protein